MTTGSDSTSPHGGTQRRWSLHGPTYGPSPSRFKKSRSPRRRLLRYLKLLATDGHSSDNHIFLRRLLEHGGPTCANALARVAPGRAELADILPPLKATAAAYFVEASRAARSRGGLSRAAAEELDRFLFGMERSALRRMPDRLLKTAFDIHCIIGSFLASPVRASEDPAKAKAFKGLPDLLADFAESVGKTFGPDNPIRLPPRYDVATDYESGVIDAVVENTDAPHFEDIGRILRTTFRVFVSKDLRNNYRRAFDGKSVADRRRRFLRRRPKDTDSALLDLIDEVQDLLFFPPAQCPKCGKQSLRLFAVLPWLTGEESGHRLYRCNAVTCGVFSESKETLVVKPA